MTPEPRPRKKRDPLPGPGRGRVYNLPPTMTVGGTAFFGNPRGEWDLRYFRTLLLASLRPITRKYGWRIRAKQVGELNGILVRRVA